MSWKRIDLDHKLKNKGHGEPGEPDTALARRIYGRDGKLWPRIAVTIRRDRLNAPMGDESYEICCSVKEKPSAWWEKSGIPIEVIGDVGEMISEAALTDWRKDQNE